MKPLLLTSKPGNRGGFLLKLPVERKQIGCSGEFGVPLRFDKIGFSLQQEPTVYLLGAMAKESLQSKGKQIRFGNFERVSGYHP